MSKKNEIILTNNGYRLNKKKISKKIIDTCKKDLTVTPYNDPDNESYKIYRETPSELIIPRFYADNNNINKNFKIKNILSNKKCKFNFKGKLRDNQIKIINDCIKHLNLKGGGTLVVGCGAGKTVMGLYLACYYGLKTLCIVHKTFLQDQWINRGEEFTNARIGMIRQNKIDVKDKDIVIGMLQSISMKDYDPEIFKDFGLVIVDEAHHTASKVYSNALYKTGAKYMIGLTATPNRQDKLTKVMKWYLGDIMYEQKKKINKQVVVKIFHYKSTSKLFVEKKRWYKGGIKPFCPTMMTNLCNLKQRTNHIINIINEIKKVPERKILILSGRKNHLYELKDKVDESIKQDTKENKILENEFKTFLYTGDSTKKERQLAENEGDILFATTDLAKEGLDISRLNTIILATSQKNITQAVGRIMRKILENGDLRPLIIDFTDELSSFSNHGKMRIKQYKKNKYAIEHYYIANNKIVTFDKYMKYFYDLDDEDIRKLSNRTVYKPELLDILKTDSVNIEEQEQEQEEQEEEQEQNKKIDYNYIKNNDVYLF
jgi:superfamily II DNA or RNA helicase